MVSKHVNISDGPSPSREHFSRELSQCSWRELAVSGSGLGSAWLVWLLQGQKEGPHITVSQSQKIVFSVIFKVLHYLAPNAFLDLPAALKDLSTQCGQLIIFEPTLQGPHLWAS